jgi:hypothetical protein
MSQKWIIYAIAVIGAIILIGTVYQMVKHHTF